MKTTLPQGDDIRELLRLTMENASATMKMCKKMLENLSPEKPELIGLQTAGKIFSRSPQWLREQLEQGKLTGYQQRPGTPWKVNPESLKKELTSVSCNNERKTTRKRRESKSRMGHRLGI